MYRIAIFASGAGTNAAAIIRHFKGSGINVKLVVCNNSGAGVLEVARVNKIPSVLIEREDFYQSQSLLKELEEHEIDFIVLAGFLWLIPQYLLRKFSGRIINLHPALLPKFGGKGMYGDRVHKAVVAAREKETGITVHFVNENYDEGKVISQVKCLIDKGDNAEMVKKKVQKLEHRYYPKIIEQVLTMVGDKLGSSL